MNQKIEVSVIIPNYNYEQYISQCIYSVIESSFDKGGVEIIVIDDASKDDSVSVVERIIKKEDFQISLIKNKSNSGLAKTRNNGIKKAKGAFLFFLDSDNYLGKNCLRDHYNFLFKHKTYSACYAPIQKFDSISGEFHSIFSNEQYDYERLKYGNYIDAMSMIKKSVFTELGGYDEKMPVNGWEDFELWLRLGENKKKITILDNKPLSFYRTHKDSMISNFSFADISVLSDYIDNKYDISVRKQPKDNFKILSSIESVMIQAFHTSLEEDFSEEKSYNRLVELEEKEQVFSFEITNESADSLTKFRFDLGSDLGLVTIHSIKFKSLSDELLYSWEVNNLLHKSDMFLIQNKDLWGEKIIQLSYSKDPQFSFQLPDNVQSKVKEGIKIEIGLSKTSQEQIYQLNHFEKPLNYLSQDKFDEIKASNYGLGAQVDKLSDLVSSATKEKELLEVISVKNDELIEEIKSDKTVLTEEIVSKNNLTQELVSQQEIIVTKLEKSILDEKHKQKEEEEKNKQQLLELKKEKQFLTNQIEEKSKLIQDLVSQNEVRAQVSSKLIEEEQIKLKSIVVKNNQLLAEINSEKNFLTNQLDEKGKLIQDLIKQHEAALKNSHDMLEEEKFNHKQAIVTHEKIVNEQNSDKELLSKEIERKSNLIERLTAQKENEVQNLMTTINEEKERNKEVQATLISEQHKLDDSRNRAESLTVKIQELNQEGKNRLSELGVLNSFVKDKEIEKNELEHRLNSTSDKLAIKDRELEEAQSHISQLNERIEELENMGIFKFLSKNKKK
jgi:glycosyltransferase involved in cell wall biosynthesis